MTDRETWYGVICGVAKSQTQLRDHHHQQQQRSHRDQMVKGRPLSRDDSPAVYLLQLLPLCSFENGFQEKVEAGGHLGNCCKDLGENLPTASDGGGEKCRRWVYLWDRANRISDRLDVVMRERKKSRYLQSFWPEPMNRWSFHLKGKSNFVYYFSSLC